MRFAGEVLANLSDYTALDESATLAMCTTDIVANLVSANSPEAIKKALVFSLFHATICNRLASAFIRVPNDDSQRLEVTEHGFGEHWHFLAKKKVAYGDTASASALAFETGERVGDLISVDERSRLRQYLLRRGLAKQDRDRILESFQARCSVPIVFGRHTFGILAVQGRQRILEDEFMEMLQLVCGVAANLLHLHGRIDELLNVREYKKKMLRWFGHDATKTVIALRDMFFEPLKCAFERSQLPDTPLDFIDQMEDLLDAMVADFLAYGWLGGEEADWSSKHGAINLLSILKPILGILSSDAPEIKFDLSGVPENLKCHVDRLKTMAILRNLMDNAVNAIREKKRRQQKAQNKGQRRDGQSFTIAVSAALKANRLQIVVKDNGCGVSREQKEDFAQGRTGQGLAIVQGFLRLAGGKVVCQSQEARGTTFTVVIPVP